MAIITVLGAGLMGTAVTYPAADNGHDIRLVGTHLDMDIIRSCKRKHYHPRLRRELAPGIKSYPHTQLGEAMEDAEVIVLGVNSRGVEWAAEALAPHLRPGQIILMVTKGLQTVDGELQILPDVLRNHLPTPIRDQVEYAAIGGPSIAGELAARFHTSVVFVSRNGAILPRLQSLFGTPYYHIWTSTDMIGVEVCVALKNAFALAVSLADGLAERRAGTVGHDPRSEKMRNYSAAIFAQGLSETAYLVRMMGGEPETIYSLPGAGDLYVTSQGGRNARMGRLLGLGLPFSDAVEEMPDETIEGVDVILAITPALNSLIARGVIEENALPVLRTMYYIVARNSPVDFDFDLFFNKLSFNPPVRGIEASAAE